MDNQNQVIVAIREFFAPLSKLTMKLPPILAYGLAIALAFLVVVLLGVVIPNSVMWLVGLIVLACLAAFVITDWHVRQQPKSTGEQTEQSTPAAHPEPIPVVAPSPDLVRIQQDRLENYLQKYAVADHERLIGVDDLLEDIRTQILNPTGDWIISLFGEGGVGKRRLHTSCQAFCYPRPVYALRLGIGQAANIRPQRNRSRQRIFTCNGPISFGKSLTN